MTDAPIVIAYFSGAGGGTINFQFLGLGPDRARIDTIPYPRWEQWANDNYTAQKLVIELAAVVEKGIPRGPIYIVGTSIGGHFGYAVALHLRAKGREVAGFCALDSFMIASADLAAGWPRRVFSRALYLLQKRRMAEFFGYLRSLLFRAVLRGTRGQLSAVLRKLQWVRGSASSDSALDAELSMRALIARTAAWIGSLDREPIPLLAPCTLFRTSHTHADDAAWRRRCPQIEIREIPGDHLTIFEAENIDKLRQAFQLATQSWR